MVVSDAPQILTERSLQDITGCEVHAAWPIVLNQAMMEFKISENLDRVCAFVAQIIYESSVFTRVEENLNYSAKRIHDVWPTRFPSIVEAQPYAHNPEKLANKIYGHRYGNRDVGDGWKYRGRGLIQLTFHDNYKLMGNMIGVDLSENPELLCRDKSISARVSACYWKVRGLNEIADLTCKDASMFDTISYLINGGHDTDKQRRICWGKVKSVFHNGGLHGKA
jgi:putative chitinase